MCFVLINLWLWYLSSIVDNTEVGIILQLLRLVELGVVTQLLTHLLHKGLVGGFGEPALLVQQSQDTRWTRLGMER